MADESITVNTTDYALRVERERNLAGLFGAIDAKRPRAWDQYGYTEHLSFDLLFKAYERGGPGHGAVHRLLDKCWQTRPRIKQPEEDKETPWEKAAAKVLRKLWPKLRDFDRRNMVGRYAGLIFRVADSRQLREPMAAGKLVDIVPVYESQLRVTEWFTDAADSENYGKPRMWQYRTRRPGVEDTQAAPMDWEEVHPSRIQILAEGSVGDFFDGVPLLRAGFNHLVDLEKIGGGSAESFLKNSSRTVVIKFDANASPQVLTQSANGTPTGQSVREAIEERTRALNRNIDSSLVLQGGEATTLQTTVQDPKPSFEVAANLFSASVQIPFTILFGQQTGRLASNEDKADMLARAKSRQENELTPMLEEFVTRLQAIGAVEKGDFEVEWPALDAPGDTEKMANAGALAAINKTQSESGQGPAFDENEVRKAAGFEERAALPELPSEGDPTADPLADPSKPPAPAPRLRAAA